jgi:endonuclease/exonuclease/phosphatase family metal-dependent hydrolase
MSSFRILTLNTCHDSVRGLAAPWPKRRESVVSIVRDAKADVACFQEASRRQVTDLASDLPEFTAQMGQPSGATQLPIWATAGKRMLRWILADFLDEGEYCPILVRRDGCVVRESGCFHLVEARGSPHVVNWASVSFKDTPAAVVVFNTHLGVWPAHALRTASELRRRLAMEWQGEPQILCGDLNALPSSKVLGLLTRSEVSPPPFRDAWAIAERTSGPTGTFHWGLGVPGPRLDYVLVGPSFKVTHAGVGPRQRQVQRASDHWPLMVDLSF